MPKLFITSVIVSDNNLFCITHSGKTFIITKPAWKDFLLKKALPEFNKNPHTILVVDTEDFCKFDLVDPTSGKTIKVTPKEIETKDGKYNISTESLIKFIEYAEEHDYSAYTFLDKICYSIKYNTKENIRALLQFCSSNNLPITVQGNILGFKVLNKTPYDGVYTDVHTGLVKQEIGDVVYMSPELVCEDRNKACASGLHICSADYLKCFYAPMSSVIALIKVNPKDIISVPTDNTAKVRCSKYQILDIFPEQDAFKLANYGNTDRIELDSILSKAINEEYTGINHNIHLLVNTVLSDKDIEKTKIGTFKYISINKRIKNNSFIKDKEENMLTKDILNLQKVKDYLNQINNKDALKSIFSLKKFFTWKELGIDDVMRKRITRRWKKYGIN